ncbi:suppressor of tumorigenicity 14 protein homolog [Neocloeon triangulifer]|uniref:suppressor of tumorigenicity 14 protein homolog n=1 Tax=Neocloeon triangulifer TaxID=2078957 RepID=UPI00286EBC1C|nr:suppressor of tumorigenicity 14 protein homolog [Neocloeon triangulifer]
MDQEKILLVLLVVWLNTVDGIYNCSNLHLNSQNGYIESPHHPGPYPDFAQCSWFISIPKNSSLSIRIVDLDISNDSPPSCEETNSCCSSNWLSIPAISHGVKVPHLLCNGMQYNRDVLLPDTLKIAVIKFHSSKNFKSSSGFKLKYAVVPHVAKHPCLSTEFSCSDSQQCVQQSQICDGKDDCSDKSDESHCDSRCTEQGLTSCPESPMVCYNASINVCSRLMSCPASQHKGWTLCKDGKACYLREQQCDQTVDCDDQTDELNCKSTEDVFFLCDDWSKWIPSNKVCDGSNDCNDHSDEDCCVNTSFETATIVGCLSCSLIFILLTSYFFFGYGQPVESTMDRNSEPSMRPSLNISGPSPYLLFREPPPPYFAEPHVSRRRYRRNRRRTSPNSVPVSSNTGSSAMGNQRDQPEAETAEEASKSSEEIPTVSTT